MHARPVTTAVAAYVLATESRMTAWSAVHQTNRRETGVRISALVVRIDGVEIG